ncbi:MAG: hypothetical protein IKN87_05175 [Bacilli bacterium]|nr:hypothetical protein [Bacilli bacterium]
MNLDEYKKEMEDILVNKKEQMEKCDHLFIKLEEGKNFQGYYLKDCYYMPCKVECVLCGLTNKYKAESKYYETKDGYLLKPNLFSNRVVKLNNMVFSSQFSRYYSKDKKSFDESVFNLMKDEVLNTDHAIYLYRRAADLRLDFGNDDLFEIMKILNDIDYEKLKDMDDDELTSIVIDKRIKVKTKNRGNN